MISPTHRALAQHSENVIGLIYVHEQVTNPPSDVDTSQTQSPGQAVLSRCYIGV